MSRARPPSLRLGPVETACRERTLLFMLRTQTAGTTGNLPGKVPDSMLDQGEPLMQHGCQGRESNQEDQNPSFHAGHGGVPAKDVNWRLSMNQSIVYFSGQATQLPDSRCNDRRCTREFES